MSFIPYAVLWVGLVCAAAVSLATERRPGLRIAVPLAALILSFLLWYLFRPDAGLPALDFAGRSWIISPVAWSLTGVALLLALAVLIPSFINGADRPARKNALSLLLTSAVLPTLWAGDGRTLLLGLAFFAVVWGFAAWAFRPRAGTDQPEQRYIIGRVGFALFPLWAAILAPDWGFLWSILAAGILMGAWPFGWRRAASDRVPNDALLRGLPLLVGAAVLADPLVSGSAGPAEIAIGTAAGLIGFAVGLARAWERPPEIAAALAMGLAGVVFVASIWAGADALPASARLAVFAPLLISYAGGAFDRQARRDDGTAGGKPVGNLPSPAIFARGVTYVALAGLPLTVGFAVFAPLYEAWRTGGGWVLLLLVVLLLTLWLAAILVGRRPAGPDSTLSWHDNWLPALAWLPAVIGLISFDLSGLTAGPVVWLAIAVPPVAGLLVGRFVPSNGGFGDLWREALALPVGAASLTRRVRDAGRLLADAAADALAILSGDYGLLLLVGLLLLLLWMA